MARLKDKVQNALDEARLLILGAQVLLGFQYRAVFETGFERLPAHSRYLKLGALIFLLIAVALLIWPGAYHRVVARGEDTEQLHRFTSRVMEIALLPFAIALSVDMFVAAEKIAGNLAGVVAGTVACLTAVIFWYGIEVLNRGAHRGGDHDGESDRSDDNVKSHTKLGDKIKHVLTETRVVLPGAQALLGFQLVTILMDGFDKLPQESKYIHLISLCMIAVTIILLMTPAAYHRIVEKGEETEHFHGFASRILLVALIPLALGVCGDLFVVTWKVTESIELASVVTPVLLLLFYGLWFGVPVYLRTHSRSNKRSTQQIDWS